jgi:Mg2+ and Co2+ transporter CorA
MKPSRSGRRLSAVLHMDSSDFALKEVIVVSETETLQSGMMLNHCILYKELSFKSSNLKPFGYSQDDQSSPAYILHKIHDSKRSEKTVPLKDAPTFLPSIGEGFNWIHVIDKRCLPLIAAKYDMHPIAVKSFLDTLPRATFNFFGKSMLYTATSFCKHIDGIICAIKLYMYICDDVVITQERRTFATVQEIKTSENVKNKPSASTFQKAENQKGKSLRNVLHTMKASHVMESETRDKYHDDCSIDQYGSYNGKIYKDMCERLSGPIALQQLHKHGSPYFLYETAYVMLEMTAPVISFYSQRQLRLHDVIYVREQPPNHAEGNAILDRVDFIKSGFQLMENLIDRSTNCLIENKDKIVDFLPAEWVSDVISSYEHALDVITDMDQELSRITDNVNSIINRRNEQISIVLSLVATVFLPLTFIAGIFGMNFDNGGVLVYMLHQRNGTNWFWASCVLCVAICLYIFVRKGWMDMLGKVRRGGHTVGAAQSNQSEVTYDAAEEE